MSKSHAPARIRLRQSLFWDVDPKTIDPKRHARYIIERILDLGDDREMYWLSHYYPKQVIRDVVRTSRVLHQKSKTLWSLVYGTR